jgi:hypothetical protein
MGVKGSTFFSPLLLVWAYFDCSFQGELRKHEALIVKCEFIEGVRIRLPFAVINEHAAGMWAVYGWGCEVFSG